MACGWAPPLLSHPCSPQTLLNTWATPALVVADKQLEESWHNKGFLRYPIPRPRLRRFFQSDLFCDFTPQAQFC